MSEMRDSVRPQHSFVPTYEPHTSVGFRRVTARHPCPVCGRKKWCQVTRDGRLAHCMSESRGAIKRAKGDGYLHVLIEDRHSVYSTRPGAISDTDQRRAFSAPTPIAPLAIRHAAYGRLIAFRPRPVSPRSLSPPPRTDCSPAGYRRKTHIVSAPCRRESATATSWRARLLASSQNSSRRTRRCTSYPASSACRASG